MPELPTSPVSAWSSAPRRVEVLFAGGIAVAGLGEVWVPFSSRQGSGSAGSATVAVLLMAVSMLWL